VVPNGYSALSLLQTTIEVDVLVTDYSMPVMDGVTLTEQALELKSDLQVIMLTTYPTKQIKERALKAGAKICISKQGGLDILLQNIRMALKG
ncbi:MAG: response regulator transcription factor, partial [Pedobacter sp.]